MRGQIPKANGSTPGLKDDLVQIAGRGGAIRLPPGFFDRNKGSDAATITHEVNRLVAGKKK